jgi:hypothetical protein
MAIGGLWATLVLWSRIAGRRVGVAAAAITSVNAVFVYYAHTGNLEVPYLFWLSLTLLELDRVAAGEAREMRAFLFAVAATLTKDQAAAALLLPMGLSMLGVPWLVRREAIVRRRLIVGTLAAFVTYACASGALVNPSGFALRLRSLLGPASTTWETYPHGLSGTLILTRDALLSAPRFTSWPLALAAVVGIAIASSQRGLERWRALLPMFAALSFTLFFNYAARRTEARFVLPQAFFLLPYAALTWDHVERAVRGRFLRALVLLTSAVALSAAALGVASVDATLLADPRYEAERFLAALPTGTHVEAYGGPIFLPRMPPGLVVSRFGIEPVAERQAIPGIVDGVDPVMDPRPRAPEILVLATELSSASAMTESSARPFGIMQYRDPVSRAMLRGLADGSLGYRRALRATCVLPWPLRCVEIHGSTAGEVWIYERTVPRR